MERFFAPKRPVSGLRPTRWSLPFALWVFGFSWVGLGAQEAEGQEAQTPPRLGRSAGEYANRTVRAIRFIGLVRVEAAAVRLVLTSRKGRPLSAAAVSEDVRAIHSMGFFEDVQAFVEPSGSGQVDLVFRVVEKPAIREVRVEGNDSLSTEEVTDVLDIRPFTILNLSRVNRNEQKVRELYAEKGYFLADVESEVEDVGDNQVDVIFRINESAKVQVRSIRFVGNRAFDDQKLKQNMATREGGLLSFLNQAGTYRPEAFEIDILRITALYYDEGYVNVRVEPPDIEISPDRKYIYITIRIEEGQQYTVGKVDLAGDLIESKDELMDRVDLKSDEIFSRSTLTSDLLELKNRYGQDGYAYANVTPLTDVDPEARIIDVTYQIDKGDLVYYERINILGNTKTRDKVIRRELRIYEGELTNSRLLELSKARVTRLGFFENVEIRTRRGSTDQLQIVDVEVTEQPTGTFQVGAGFSSLENFIFTAQIAQQNFLGRGQSLQLSASISAVRQQFNLQFFEPYLYDTRWSLSVRAFNNDLQFSNFDRAARGGEILVGHPLDFISEDLIIQAGYGLEFVDNSSVFGTNQPLFQPLINSGRISKLRTILSFDNRDNRLFPTKGMFHTLSAEVSAPFLGATRNRSFQKLRAWTRFYYPIFWKFIGRLQLRIGWLNPDSDREFAPSENFFLGGIQSLRGYPPFSIGPERQAAPNPSSNQDVDPFAGDFAFVEGGNKEFLMNLEIEFPILEAVNIRGVVFLDAGNTFGQDENLFYLGGEARGSAYGPDSAFFFDYEEELPLGLFWSTGFGFRWFSPIGPLRFEWGFPLNQRPIVDDQSPLFEFSIGNSF
jgi:outer membrane protein insertion porin family